MFSDISVVFNIFRIRFQVAEHPRQNQHQGKLQLKKKVKLNSLKMKATNLCEMKSTQKLSTVTQSELVLALES